MSDIPKRIEKPWGYEIWWARTDRYVGKILHVRKGEGSRGLRLAVDNDAAEETAVTRMVDDSGETHE